MSESRESVDLTVIFRRWVARIVVRLFKLAALVAVGSVAIAVGTSDCTGNAEEPPVPVTYLTARAVPVSPGTAREMLADVTRWDAATPGERRAVAEQVDERLPDFALLGVSAFGFDGARHEIAVFAHAATGLEFSLLPGGTFRMGSEDGDWRRRGFEPIRDVTLSDAFLLARTECTQAAWMRVTQTNPAIGAEAPDHPVESVSWNDAQEFCERSGLRLPSDEEWEYACRAGTTTRFWSGDGYDDVSHVAWVYDPPGRLAACFGRVRDLLGLTDASSYPHAVARKPANPFGLHDVHGNVWEWCADEFVLPLRGEDVERAPAPTAAAAASAVPGADALRAGRGGSGWYGADMARSALRNGAEPWIRSGWLGFRPARSVPPER